jgi:hypothetical protein
MVVLIFFRSGAMVFLRANVELTPQDGLDPPGRRSFKKMHCAVDVAVIGDGHGLLSDAVDVGYKLFDITSAIQERIVCVQMEVGKLSHGIALV